MYYNTLVTYRDPSTGNPSNVIGLYHAKSDAEALGMAISGAEEFVPKGHQIVSHTVYPVPDHPYSRDNAVAISNGNSEKDVYITLLARKIPRSLPAVINLLHYLDDIDFEEPTVEAFKEFVPSKSHEEKFRVLVDLLKVAERLAKDLEGGFHEYKAFTVKALTEAIANSVSTTVGSNAQADS